MRKSGASLIQTQGNDHLFRGNANILSGLSHAQSRAISHLPNVLTASLTLREVNLGRPHVRPDCPASRADVLRTPSIWREPKDVVVQAFRRTMPGSRQHDENSQLALCVKFRPGSSRKCTVVSSVPRICLDGGVSPLLTFDIDQKHPPAGEYNVVVDLSRACVVRDRTEHFPDSNCVSHFWF